MKSKRSAGVAVFNDDNELLLQLRSLHDDTYPGYWDFSAAGGIKPEEDHKTAALRELQEELGITQDVEYLYKLEYVDKDTNKTLFLYKTYSNGPFYPDSNEVEKVAFFSKQKIQNMIESKEKFHPEVPLIWKVNILFPSS